MDSKIAVLVFVVAIAVFLPTVKAHKCYACNSLNNRNNECATLSEIQPSECNSHSFSSLSQNNFPQAIKNIFGGGQSQYQSNEWNCAKLLIHDDNVPSSTNYTIRTCIPLNDKNTFCAKATESLTAQHYRLECYLCGDKESCNSASSMGISLLPIFAIFVLSSYILKA